MKQIEVIVPENGTRGWHGQLVERLRAAGNRVGVQTVPMPGDSRLLEFVLGAEQRCLLFSASTLLARADLAPVPPDQPPDLRIDLTGTLKAGGPPLLAVGLEGAQTFSQLATAIAAGQLPEITVTLDDKTYDVARPMIDNRVVISRGLEDLFARTISLLVASSRRVLDNRSAPVSASSPGRPSNNGEHARDAFLQSYLVNIFPKLLHKVVRRLKGRHHDHWRVGYRFVDGPGVAESGDLSGPQWFVLPDDGSRFYADPFPYVIGDRHFIFVEDYAHDVGKGIISVSEISPDGTATKPRPVIEEDYHLSYPQVFEHGGDIWMLPEASASGSLVLYRAEELPNNWSRHAVLVEGHELSDATLVCHEDRLWLIATERDGAGSAADMMVVLHAETLQGPWTPHQDNPILIDRTRARPGGAVIKSGGRLLLPVQDGTKGYGGGLGICEITSLTVDSVTLSEPTPVDGEGFWPHPAMHTLNRVDRLETVDGIVGP